MPWWRRFGDALLGSHPKRRIRTTQWLITALVYLASALVLWFGIGQGWMNGPGVVAWSTFMSIGLTAVYVAIRSGWSERFSDPALTVTQMLLGIVAVEWGYLICGPVRSVALFPLMLIFTFGAFSLDWRRLGWLTAIALVSLIACVVALHTLHDGAPDVSLDNAELRLDLSNVLILTILLPALSLVSARLSSLRSRLRQQRADLTAALEEVQRVAIRDELTGLANRRHMLERLEQEKSRYQRSGAPFSIAVIDLDHFKRYNDEFGHAGGDEVLRMFADHAGSTLRAADLLARWGGEEFLLLMPDTLGAQAKVGVERVLANVRATPMKREAPLSFSAGVTEHRATETLTETVARADRAMYEAKRAGRNGVVLH